MALKMHKSHKHLSRKTKKHTSRKNTNKKINQKKQTHKTHKSKNYNSKNYNSKNYNSKNYNRRMQRQKGGNSNCSLASVKEPGFNVVGLGDIPGLSISDSRGAIYRPNCKTDTYQAMTP